MNSNIKYKTITYLLAAIWLINGLYCKIFNFIPRHQQIVGEILGEEYASILTLTIGALEIAMAVWIVIGIKSKWNAIAQIVIILSMNLLEFFLVSDLLLWGGFNMIFALILALIIYFNEFKMKKTKRYV